jgi:hypothetical protein
MSGLVYPNDYYFACYPEDTLGNQGSQLGQQYSTPCCKSVAFNKKSTVPALNTQEQYQSLDQVSLNSYSIPFSIDSLPSSGSLTLQVNFYQTSSGVVAKSGVFARPSSFDFSTGSGLTGSFIVYGDVGLVYAQLSPSTAEYSPSSLLAVNVTGTTIPPKLTQTVFESSGQTLLISLSPATDQGQSTLTSISGIWNCSLLFHFLGDMNSGCVWVNSSTVKVFLNYYRSGALLLPGAPMTLKSGVLRATCTLPCTGYSFAQATTVYVAVPQTSITATPVLILPSSISSCFNLTIDATQSTGSGGRSWQTISWVVTGDDSANALILQNYLVGVVNPTSRVFSVPSSYLFPGLYTISLGLKNFLANSSALVSSKSAQTRVTSDVTQSILDVSLEGSTLVSITRDQTVSKRVLAVLRNCDGVVSSAQYSYSWRVSRNGITVGNKTLSNDPAVFSAKSKTFETGSEYKVEVTVTAKVQSLSYSKTSQFTLEIIRGEVVALINGAKQTQMSLSVGNTLKLDGSQSYDPDVTGTASLTYSWTCKETSATNYGLVCPFLTAAQQDKSTVTFAPETFTAASSYVLTLVVSSTVAGVSKSSQAMITLVTSSSGGASTVAFAQPTSSKGLGAKVVLSATVLGDSAITATWSLSSDNSATITAFTPLTRQFSTSDVSSGITFPLGLTSSMFVQDVSYTFRITLQDTAGAISYTEVSVTPNSAPYGGSMTVSPLEGFALVTPYTLSTTDWVDFDLPLSYQFQYQVSDAFDESILPSNLGSVGSAVSKTTTLPAGTASLHHVVCLVEVFDSMGSSTFTSIVVSSEVSESQIQDEYNNRYPASSSRRLAVDSSSFSSFIFGTVLPNIQIEAEGYYEGNNTALLQDSLSEAKNLFNLVELSNCSFAPDCVSLNRQSCSATPHTCGACLTGFTGVYGDSNVLCVTDDGNALAAGQQCATSSQCQSGVCTSGVCVKPMKSCLKNKQTGSVCSGRGTCLYEDYQHNPVAQCSYDNSSCVAYCACDSRSSFGGDCGLSLTEIESVSTVRGDYCAVLNSFAELLDPDMASVSLLVQMLRSYYDPHEFALLDPLLSCSVVLDTLSLKLSSAIDNGGEITPTLAQGLTDLISELVDTDQLSAISNRVFTLLTDYQAAIHSSLVPGQEPDTYTSDNLRVSFRYDLVSGLSGIQFLSPQTESEKFYSSTQSSVTLPAGGLAPCRGFDKYGKFLLTSWGFSPFQFSDEIAINGPLFSVSPINTTVGSGYDGVESPYFMSLSLFEPISDDKQGQCYEINSLRPNAAEVCTSCDIYSSNSKDSNVTLNCSNALDAFCPIAVASSSVSRRAQAENLFSNFAHRGLAGASGDTYYVVGLIDGPIRIRSYGAIPDKVGNRAVSTISIILFLVLIGSIVLFFWDRMDRFDFIAARASEKELNPSRQFNLLDVFEQSGRSEISSPNTRTGMKSLSSGKSDHLAIGDGSGADKSNQVVKVEEVQFGVDHDDEVDLASDLPESSLLSSKDWYTRFVRALKRHHRWVRIFTYPSIEKPRLIRFFVVCTDVISIIFATTLFYQIYYPDDDTCEQKRYKDNCLNTDSAFRLGEKLCTWDEKSQFCVLKPPPFNMFFIVTVSMIILVLSMPFRRFLQVVLEKLCAKRPDTAAFFLQDEPALWGGNSDEVDEEKQSIVAYPMVGKEAPAYRLAYCDSMTADAELNVLIASTKEFFNNTLAEVPIPWRENGDETEAHLGGRQLALMGAIMRWMNVHPDGTPANLSLMDRLRFTRPLNKLTYKIQKVRRVTGWVVDKVTDEVNFAAGQVDYQNNVLLQEFVMEQLSPICRFAIKRDLFNLDNSSPGRLPLIKWVLAWIFAFVTTGFMSSWIIYWSVTNGGKVADAWGMTLFVVLVCDALMNELFQIYFINVLVTDKLRPQLRQIYAVFDHVMRTRLHDHLPSQNVRIVQHTSAACRATRTPELKTLIASNILGVMDDADIAICRLKRLTKVFDIGVVAYLTLYLPSYLTDCYEIIQQTSLDMVLPIFWSCFLLLSFVLNRVHPALLGMFYFFLLLVFIFIVFIAPSDWFKRLINQDEETEGQPRGEDEDENVESLRHQNLMRVEADRASRDSMKPADMSWRGMNNVTPGAYELTGFQIDLVEFDQDFSEQSMDGLYDSFGTVNLRNKRGSSRQEHEQHDDIMDSTTALPLAAAPAPAPSSARGEGRVVVKAASSGVLGSDFEGEEEEGGRVSVHTREVVNEVKRNSIYLKSRESQEVALPEEVDEEETI